MIVCPSCGNESLADESICQHCGRRFAERGVVGASALEAVAAHLNAGTAGSGGLGSAPSRATANGATHGVSPEPAPVSGPTARAIAVARLLVRRVVEGESEGIQQAEEFLLDGRSIAIGRSPSCDIVLTEDQLVSRRHALLRSDGTTYTIVDLGSSNGTYVNDAEIRETTRLGNGDRILIGEYEIAYSTAPASTTAVLPGSQETPGRPDALPTATNPSATAIAASDAAPAEATESTSAPIEEVAQAAEAPAATDAAAEAAEAPAALASAAEQAPVAAPAGTADITSSTAEFTVIQSQLAQLAESSASLVRRTVLEAQRAEQRGAALQQVRERIEAMLAAIAAEPQRLLAEPGEGADQAEAVHGLIDIARQTAEHPRHLDYVTQLAEHAGEIAALLEARQSAQPAPANADLVATLEALRALLDGVE